MEEEAGEHVEGGRHLGEVRRRALAAAQVREAPDSVAGHRQPRSLVQHLQERVQDALVRDFKKKCNMRNCEHLNQGNVTTR